MSALRIGTRGSALAQAQAKLVAEALMRAGGLEAELVTITTSGDRGASPASDPAGVKGLFVTEIVQALQGGDVDLAVHSAKDLPAADPAGVQVMAVPRRATAFDVLIAKDEGDLPPGARVGTSSLRRRAQLAAYRPEVEIVEIRGNVDTRLAKLDAGEVDALVLAAAGLERLGLHLANTTMMADILPAPGQGALAVQMRSDDERRFDVIDALDHEDSHAAFLAERHLMKLLGGGCALPLGGYAQVESGSVHLQGAVFEPDGSNVVRAASASESPHQVASTVAADLRAGGGAEILDRVRG